MANADVTVNLDVSNLEVVKAAIAQLRKERDEARDELKRAREYASELFDEAIQDGCDYGDLLQKADVAVSLVEDAQYLRTYGEHTHCNKSERAETWPEFDRQAEDFMRRHGQAIVLQAAKSRREMGPDEEVSP